MTKVRYMWVFGFWITDFGSTYDVCANAIILEGASRDCQMRPARASAVSRDAKRSASSSRRTSSPRTSSSRKRGPMIVGYHLIFGAYGFWLPNDPRGSWSDFVGSWELYRYGGPATKTSETRSLANVPHDHAARIAAKRALLRPAVQFTGLQARAVVGGFADYVHLVTGLLPIPALLWQLHVGQASCLPVTIATAGWKPALRRQLFGCSSFSSRARPHGT